MKFTPIIETEEKKKKFIPIPEAVEVGKKTVSGFTTPQRPLTTTPPSEASVEEKAKILSATLDIPYSVAYDTMDVLEKEFTQWDGEWIKKSKKSFKAGIGQTSILFGQMLEYAGLGGEVSRTAIKEGQRIRDAYIAPMSEKEFDFKDMLKADWWATRPFEMMPIGLSLIPAAIVGAYGGVKAGALMGLGAFGKKFLAYLGASSVSAVLGAGYEAAETYDNQLAEGKSVEEARERANFTFKYNVASLLATDYSQFLLAFTPLNKLGLSGTLGKRVAATALKVGGVGAIGAAEETWQGAIQQAARGEIPAWGPELKESFALGFILDAGLGGAGSVWTLINDAVMVKADKKLLDTFETTRQAKLAIGATPEEAYMAGLDAIAETPEGDRLIQGIAKDWKNKVEGKEVEVKTPEEVQKAIEELVEKTELDEIAQEDVEAVLDERADILDILEDIEPEAVEKETPVKEEATESKMFISEDLYNRAKASLSEKLKPGTLRAGIDPTIVSDLAVIGAYHLEKIGRKFGAWSRAMINELGEEIKPHLRRLWKEANAYLSATVAPEKVKGIIREKTGQKRVYEYIREDEAFKAAFRKAQEHARAAYKAGEQDAIRQAKADFENLLLMARVEVDLMKANKGITDQSELSNAHLRRLFREGLKEMHKGRKEIVRYISEHLPLDVRGKYLNAVIENLTPKKKERLFSRVEQHREKLERASLIEEIEKLQEMRGNIAVKYQKEIKELIGDIETRKMTSKTINRLQGLKNYIEEHGVPLGISTERIRELDRLSKKQAQDLTLDELRYLKETAEHLTNLGKLFSKLEFQFNERARQEALSKLINSTHNIDAKETGNETIDKVKRGMMFLYLDHLQPIRTFKWLDGLKDGENVSLYKKIATTGSKAELRARAIKDSAMTDIHNLDIGTITDEQKVRIMINKMFLEEAYDQVNTLMNHYGYEELPALTEKEQKLLEIMEKYVGSLTDEYATTYETMKKQIFPRLPRYILPIIYADENLIFNPEELPHVKHRTTHVEQGSTIERQLNVARLPSIEIFDIFEHAIDSMVWYIEMEPVLNNAKHLVLTKEYIEAGGREAYQYWKTFLDTMARKGGSASANHTPFSNLLKFFRGNITKALLGYKLSSIIMQPFAVFDAMAYAQANYGTIPALEIFAEVSKAIVNPSFAKEYEKSVFLALRAGAGEQSLAELLKKVEHSQSAYDKFIKGGMSLLMAFDIKTATGVESAFEKILTRHNIPNAKEEAGVLMNMVSSSSDVAFRPLVLSRGEGARTLYTLQTFFINRFGVIAHDIIFTGLIKGDWKKKYAAMMALGIIVFSKIAEDETREFLYELTTGKEMPDNASTFKRIMYAVPSNIPFFGNFFEMTRYSKGILDIPIARVGANLFRIFDVFEKDEWDKKIKGALSAVESGLTLFVGLPGIAQSFDILEGIFLPEKEKEPKLEIPKLERPKPER